MTTITIPNKKHIDCASAMFALYDLVTDAINDGRLHRSQKYHYIIVHRPNARKYKYIIHHWRDDIDGYSVSSSGLFTTWDLSDYDDVI